MKPPRWSCRVTAARVWELRPGGETVISRLADILVIQAIRSWIQEKPGIKVSTITSLGSLKSRYSNMYRHELVVDTYVCSQKSNPEERS